jgi:hypothetical protein
MPSVAAACDAPMACSSSGSRCTPMQDVKRRKQRLTQTSPKQMQQGWEQQQAAREPYPTLPSPTHPPAPAPPAAPPRPRARG